MGEVKVLHFYTYITRSLDEFFILAVSQVVQKQENHGKFEMIPSDKINNKT